MLWLCLIETQEKGDEQRPPPRGVPWIAPHRPRGGWRERNGRFALPHYLSVGRNGRLPR
jgi:hypothetical protein